VAGGQDYERMTPQGDSVPALAVYTDNGDAERQPLLARMEDDEEDDRVEPSWVFTLGIATAIGIATFVILYMWRQVEEEGALVRTVSST
jgi:hypothetical protein